MSDDTSPIPQPGKRTLKIVLQIAAIILFGLLIAYFMRRYSADISAVRNLALKDLLLIGLWSFVSYSSYAYAVYIVLVDLGLKGISAFGWLRIYYVSRLVNLFIVQGGNLFRLLVLKKRFGFSYANSIGVTVFLIWLNATIALLAASFFLSQLDVLPRIMGVGMLGWSLLALLALLLFPLGAVGAIWPSRNSAFWKSRYMEPFPKIAKFFVDTLTSPPLLLRISLLSVVHYGFFVGVNYFSFQALGQVVGIGEACFFTTAFVFTRYVNVVPGNLGLSELVGGLLSELLGVGFGNGLLVAGIVRIVEVIMILLLGLLHGNKLAWNFLRERQ